MGVKPYKRILLWLGGELAGILLLILFVILLATMPPLKVNQVAPGGPTKVSVKTDVWAENMTTYWKTIQAGSLGTDQYGRAVGPLVAKRLTNSLKLVGTALFLATGLGVAKGFADFMALRRKPIAIGPILTGAVQGVPDFWLILMLQLGAAWLYRTFGWNPFKVAWNADQPLASMVLPLISLTLIPLASVARMTNVAMVNVYDREYIRTARVKGLGEFLVVFKHGFRNAIVQILDGLPSMAAVMLSNLLIVEYLFNYPGLTTLLKQAILPVSVTDQLTYGVTRDPNIPVIIAAGVALGLLFSGAYLVVRVLRQIADPRLKEREQR